MAGNSEVFLDMQRGRGGMKRPGCVSLLLNSFYFILRTRHHAKESFHSKLAQEASLEQASLELATPQRCFFQQALFHVKISSHTRMTQSALEMWVRERCQGKCEAPTFLLITPSRHALQEVKHLVSFDSGKTNHQKLPMLPLLT